MLHQETHENTNLGWYHFSTVLQISKFAQLPLTLPCSPATLKIILLKTIYDNLETGKGIFCVSSLETFFKNSFLGKHSKFSWYLLNTHRSELYVALSDQGNSTLKRKEGWSRKGNKRLEFGLTKNQPIQYVHE